MLYKIKTAGAVVKLNNVGKGFGALLSSFIDLTKSEIHLAKTEGEVQISSVLNKIFLKVAGVFCLLSGVVFLAISVVFGLKIYLVENYAISLLIVGFVLAASGAFIVFKPLKK